MGNILGKIHDDEERYESLCEKYGEEPQELYSHHYQWVMKRHLADTPESFDAYLIPERITEVEGKITAVEKQVRDLNFKLANLRAELIQLERKKKML